MSLSIGFVRRGSLDLPSGRLHVGRRASQTDRRAVLLIFFGFSARGTVDMAGNSLSMIRNEVIRIHDEIGEFSKESYYIAASGGYGSSSLAKEFFELLAAERRIEYR